MKILHLAGALAFACLATPALAQTAPKIVVTGNPPSAEMLAFCWRQADGTCIAVGALNPLPVVLSGGTPGGSAGDPSSTGTAGSTSAPATVSMQGLYDGTTVRRALSDASGRMWTNVYSLPPLPASPNTIGTVNLGTIGGAATAANQAAMQSTLALGRDSGGRLLPGQGVVTSTRTALGASTPTSISGAAVGRVGLTVQVEAALTANLYLCTSQAGSCSATSYDALIPSGAGAGTTYTFLLAPNSALYAFSAAAATLVANSWSAQ